MPIVVSLNVGVGVQGLYNSNFHYIHDRDLLVIMKNRLGLGNEMTMKKRPVVAKSGTQKQILIVDDHPLIRFALAMALSKNQDYLICGEAVDHHEALAKIRELSPDLVTVDLTLAHSHGMELIKDIRAQFPELLVLVVSVHDEFLNIRRVMRAGVRGYVTKLEPLTQVLAAVERIFAGEIHVSHQVTTQMALNLAGWKRNYQVPDLQNLTDRELEIFELTGDGLNVRQIATRLKLAITTIDTYRKQIKEKLCLIDHSQLLQSAIRCNRSGNFNGKPVAAQADAL